MTEAELRAALAENPAEERRPVTDWARVRALASDLIRRLNTEPEPAHPVEVYRFLDDVDIRRKMRAAGIPPMRPGNGPLLRLF